MELREFVAQAISQITEGVVDAQKATEGNGAIVNPPLILNPNGIPSLNYGDRKQYVSQTVSFDVKVYAETTTGGSGSGKISIACASLGLGGGTETKNSTASSITFSVPILLPLALEKKSTTCAPSVQIDTGERHQGWR